jgi:enamine deaminase RidA (YjgF/YER057c/UK114 family)
MTIQRFENGPRFCRVLSHNGTVYLAGMTTDDLTGDVVQQTRDTLSKIDHYLAVAGSDKSKLLTALIWLREDGGPGHIQLDRNGQPDPPDLGIPHHAGSR